MKMKSESRVVRGFHRLGLLLAVPLLLAAAGFAVFACFSNGGPVVADPAEPKSTLRIVLATQTSSDVNKMTNEELVAATGRALVSQGAASTIANIDVEMGPIRTFEFYWANPKTPASKPPDEEMVADVLTSITEFERRRGAVISAREQPVLVGDLVVLEAGERKQPYRTWTHLKHGFHWEPVWWAAGLAAFAILIYVISRALGWVIDGFVSKPES